MRRHSSGCKLNLNPTPYTLHPKQEVLAAAFTGMETTKDAVSFAWVSDQQGGGGRRAEGLVERRQEGSARDCVSRLVNASASDLFELPYGLELASERASSLILQ